MARFPGFIGSSYASQASIADAEETINFYVERMEAEQAKNAAALYPTPGFSVFAQTPQIGTRGGINANGRVFFVIATRLYEVLVDGSVLERGIVAQDNNPATLSYNGLSGGQLFITTGGNGYCYVLATNTLTLVLNGEATMGAFANARFLAFNILTGKVRMSALNDGTGPAWDPNLYFTRTIFADPWQAMFVDGQSLIWLPGTESYEAWYVTNDATNPFAPLSGLVGRYGIASSFGFTLAGNQVLWLSANHEGAGTIITAQGGGRSIATAALDTAIAGYQRTTKITDAEAFTYQEAGHTFAIWAFPSVQGTPSTTPTWALDVDQHSWCRRGKWTANQNRYDLWTPRVHVSAFGKHLVGDRTTGTIAVMDGTVGTELDGTGIRRLRRAPSRTREYHRDPISMFQLLMDTGVGVVAGAAQDVDPQAMLRVSGDGCKTFGNERRAGFGRVGETRRRCYWCRLGAAPDFGVEVTFATKVPTRVIDAWINPTDQEQQAA